ncbi:hypothetical protein Lalb_Chr12g0199131 [Lupinus albus]|uniref:Uncharacterized protein n=1 Tax=Lupinus albus TaxID=3870 RepID=A0A6A4PLG5_LUPAL|nr:hypothetical protein Lalb_Chr12g0199131 [Lupinus albus]
MYFPFEQWKVSSSGGFIKGRRSCELEKGVKGKGEKEKGRGGGRALPKGTIMILYFWVSVSFSSKVVWCICPYKVGNLCYTPLYILQVGDF